MSNGTQTPPTGIVGNTPPPLNGAAAPTATAARVNTLNQSTASKRNIASIAIFFFFAVILLNDPKITFAWGVVIAIGLIFGSRLLRRNLTFSWPEFLRMTGWGILIGLLLFGSIGQLLITKINGVEAKVAEANLDASLAGDDVKCPKGVIIPVAGANRIDVPIDCVATLDVTALPLDDRGLDYDLERSDEVFSGKEPHDFVQLSEIRNKTGRLVGYKVTPVPSAFRQINRKAVPLFFYSHKWKEAEMATTTGNPELAAALANAN